MTEAFKTVEERRPAWFRGAAGLDHSGAEAAAQNVQCHGGREMLSMMDSSAPTPPPRCHSAMLAVVGQAGDPGSQSDGEPMLDGEKHFVYCQTCLQYKYIVSESVALVSWT